MGQYFYVQNPSNCIIIEEHNSKSFVTEKIILDSLAQMLKFKQHAWCRSGTEQENELSFFQ